MSDDNLPDGIADVLHNMSHALHALSDVTFNFHSPDPQSVSCLPRINPVSVPVQPRPSTSNDASRASSNTTTTANGGQPHFHINPHIHTHLPNVSASAPPHQPQQSQQTRPIGIPQPFGVSVYVIFNEN